MNKQLLLDLCHEQRSGDGGAIATDAFTSILHTMRVPLQSDNLTSLLAIYDKKGEGVMNYDDYISEQKYIHAVSHGQYYTDMLCTYSTRWNFVISKVWILLFRSYMHIHSLHMRMHTHAHTHTLMNFIFT